MDSNEAITFESSSFERRSSCVVGADKMQLTPVYVLLTGRVGRKGVVGRYTSPVNEATGHGGSASPLRCMGWGFRRYLIIPGKCHFLDIWGFPGEILGTSDAIFNYVRQMSRHVATFHLFLPGKCHFQMSRHLRKPQPARRAVQSSS